MDAVKLLQNHIERRGVLCTFLAKKMGISKSHLSNILAGRRPITEKMEAKIKKICE